MSIFTFLEKTHRPLIISISTARAVWSASILQLSCSSILPQDGIVGAACRSVWCDHQNLAYLLHLGGNHHRLHGGPRLEGLVWRQWKAELPLLETWFDLLPPSTNSPDHNWLLHFMAERKIGRQDWSVHHCPSVPLSPYHNSVLPPVPHCLLILQGHTWGLR